MDAQVAEWHLRESGDPAAPAVVFLHGAGLSGRMWSPHIAKLEAFHCLAPDLPGCGRSSRLRWTSTAGAADHVADLIRTRAAARRAHVVGISLGGAIAHALVARHSDLVERLIIDGAGVLPSWRNAGFLLGLAAIAPFLHTRPVLAALSRSVGEIPAAVREDMRLASRTDFWRSYRDALGTRATRTEIAATCQALFVAGEKEPIVRRSNAALAGLMPHAEARFVPGLGHGWLGTRLDLHVEMTVAWLSAGSLPAGLAFEKRWPGATQRLLRHLGP